MNMKSWLVKSEKLKWWFQGLVLRDKKHLEMITSLSQLDPNGSYTYADYLAWKIEERIELIKGRIAQMAAPSRYHQDISSNLHAHIKNLLWRSPCKVYAAPFDVRLMHFSQKKNKEITTVVQPDLCVICDPKKLDDRGCLGAPDLIIEILSPGNSKREMKDKYEVYEEAGVREYWLVNPTEKSVQVFQLNEAGKFIGIQPFVEDDIMTTPILPDLQINLMEVFED